MQGSVDGAMAAFSQFGATSVLVLLILLSILSVAVMIERLVFYMKRRVDSGRLAHELGALLDKQDLSAARALFQGDTMEDHVLRIGLGLVDKGHRVMTESMDAELVRQRTRFESYLVFLGTLGNNAPFIGLFGTVLGIIKAFRDLALNDPTKATAGAQVVMRGISEALVATAVGLAVALPAVVAFNYFKTVVKRVVANTESLSRVLTARVAGPSGE